MAVVALWPGNGRGALGGSESGPDPQAGQGATGSSDHSTDLAPLGSGLAGLLFLGGREASPALLPRLLIPTG